MAYEGLTEAQRTQVRDAGRALQSVLGELVGDGADGDTFTDIGLRRVEAYELLRKFFEAETFDWVVLLRKRDVPFPVIGKAAGLGRGGAETRWARKVASRAATTATVAATTDPAAASTAETVAADA